MEQLENEITITDRKQSAERLKSYEKAMEALLENVKKNKNKEGAAN